MLTKELYTKVKTIIEKAANRVAVDGPEFMAVFNEVFNTTMTFSNCCPSENKQLLNKLKKEARAFEKANPKEAAVIIAEVRGVEPPTAEEKKTEEPEKENPAPEKKKRGPGRPRKKKTPPPAPPVNEGGDEK